MVMWNLKLANIQKAAKRSDWNERGNITETEQAALSYPTVDLTCIPANSKPRSPLESQYAASERNQHSNRFSAVVGTNSDLVNRPTLIGAPMVDPYQPPRSLDPLVPQQPADLASDLYRCTTCTASTTTVEDKDPSMFWQMTCNSIFILFYYWFTTMSKCPRRLRPVLANGWQMHRREAVESSPPRRTNTRRSHRSGQRRRRSRKAPRDPVLQQVQPVRCNHGRSEATDVIEGLRKLCSIQ